MTGMARLLVAAGIGFGLVYPLLWLSPLAPAAMIAVKGAGVGLLAAAAAIQARSLDGWLLASLLALGALGDVLLEIHFAAGAGAFAAGHVVAIALYLRNRREGCGPLDRAVAGAPLLVAAIVPALLLQGRPEAAPFTAYALLLGAMTATAWLSRFPRPLVALGAWLFLISDMLIALRLAGGPEGLGLPIWLLYFSGQLLIFLGVSSSLTRKPMGREPARPVDYS